MSEIKNTKEELKLRDDIFEVFQSASLEQGEKLVVLFCTAYEIFRCFEMKDVNPIEYFEDIITNIEKQENGKFNPDYLRTHKQRHEVDMELRKELLDEISKLNTRAEPYKAIAEKLADALKKNMSLVKVIVEGEVNYFNSDYYSDYVLGENALAKFEEIRK